MAISVDTVYQTVLALANKEQRGYITPQEFNLFAKQAQMEIFEQYFYDVNQFSRRPRSENIAFDAKEITLDKLEIFKVFVNLQDENPQNPDNHTNVLPGDWYRTVAVYDQSGGGNPSRIDKVTMSEYQAAIQSGYMTRPNRHRPVYYNDYNPTSGNPRIFIYPNLGSAAFVSETGGSYSGTTSKIKLEYYKKPKDPKWTYIVVNDKAIWNPSPGAGGQDFQLHASEERDLILKILQLAGITIKDFALVQAAGQEVANVVQQEKQ